MKATTGAALFSAINVSAVTTLATGGVHRAIAPEGTTAPHVIVQAVFATIPASHNEATDSQTDTVQVSCFATSFESASAIRDAVRTALDNVALSTGDKPTANDERDDYDQVAQLHRCDIDFTV